MDLKARIVFENEHFLFVDKPGSWLSVPSQWGKEDPRPVLGLQLIEQLGFHLIPVHRLDFEVSGLMMYAKHETSHRVASEWFESREIDKTYEAWTTATEEAPAPNPQGQEWTSHLHRGKKRSFVSPHGKLAVTRAYWKGQIPSTTHVFHRWHLDPLTGRPHQLRVELANHHYPILGDELYGSQVAFMPEHIALRAIRLRIENCRQYTKWGLPELIEVAGIESLLSAEWKQQMGLDPATENS